MKLLNCPFCGNVAQYMHIRGSYGYTPNMIQVKCSSCWCQTPPKETERWENKRGHFDCTEEAKLSVMMMWNERVSNTCKPLKESKGLTYL